jgi:hypothetical protein
MTAREIEEHIRLDDGGMPSEMIDMHVNIIKQYAIDFGFEVWMVDNPMRRKDAELYYKKWLEDRGTVSDGNICVASN